MSPTKSHADKGRPLRALLIDDHDDTRLLYAEYLREQGWHIEDVASGAEALEVAPDFAPDVIVVDVAMPGIDGLETTRRLRAHASTSTVPIVILTAYPAYDAECYAAGCSAFVTKPCSSPSLLGVLESVLASERWTARVPYGAGRSQAGNDEPAA